MADRYWVGSGSWTSANTTNWSTTSGGAGGASVPTSADNVFLNASSGTCTLSGAGLVCLSLDFTGYTSTFTASSGISIYGGLTLSASMTLAVNGVFIIFAATTDNGGAGWPITTNGKALPNGSANNYAFSGTGGKWVFQDAITFGNAATISHTAGTLNFNSQTVTALAFTSSTAAARTLTLGSSAITLTGPNPWNVGGTAPTVTANTAVVTFTGNTGAMTMGSTNYNGVSMVFTGITAIGGPIFTGNFTVGNLTFTGTANKATEATFAGSVTCTTSFIVNGNSAENRFWVKANTPGTAITISAPSTTLTNVDFMDIIGTGGGSWSGTSIGNCWGNTGITFSPSVARYAVAAGNVSSTAMWSATNGGAAGASVPLPQDSVYFTSSSGAGTYTFDMPRIGRDKDFTGFTRTVAYTSGLPIYHFGSVILSSTMTFTAVNTSLHYFMGRGTHTIVSAGKSFFPTNANGGINMFAVGGSYTLGDAFTNYPGVFTLHSGTFDTASYSLTVGSVASSGTSTRAMYLGTSIVTLLQTTSGSWTVSGTGMTMSAASATISFGVAFNGARTFSGNGYTYGTLDYTVANSPGSLAISGAPIIGTLNVGHGRTVTGAASTVTTVGALNATGQANGYLYMNGPGAASVPDSAATSPTGTITVACRCALDDWTPSAISYLATKWNSNNARSFVFGVNTNGTLTLAVSNNGGGTSFTFNSTAAPAFTDGSTYWVAATYTPSTGECKFWTASGASNTFPTGAAWTQLGTTSTVGAVGIFDGTALFLTGGSNDGGVSPPSGKFYRTILANNTLLDGTGIVCDMDFTTKTWGSNTFVEGSSNAATVTLTGNAIVGDGRVALASATAATATYIALAGDRPTLDYLTVQDVISTIPYKFYAGDNSVNVSGNTNVTFTAAPATGPYIRSEGEATATATTTITAALPAIAPAVAGELLLMLVGYSGGAPGTLAGPSGWNTITVVNDSTTAALVGYWKVAVGGETSATATNTSSSGVSLTARLIVVAGLGALPTVTTGSATAGGSSVTALSSGSASNTTAAALAIGAWVTSGTFGATVSTTNSYQMSRPAATESTRLRTAVKPVTATGSNTSTLTWTTAATRAIGEMIVLNSTPTGNQAGLLAFFI